MAKKSNTRDYARVENRLIRQIDASRQNPMQQGWNQSSYDRRSDGCWRVPLVELVPALPTLLAQVMVM